MGYRIHPLVAAMAVAFSSLACQQATAQTTLNEVVVNAGKIRDAATPQQIGAAEIAAQHAITRDAAALLRDVPGVSLYGAGGVSSLPVIHGLADDRLRITVDGMDFIASCPNHMNPPMSYLDPTNVAKIKVFAGITPVSVGGDSIGGTIVAETAAPQFAAPGQGTLAKGEIGAFFHSNNNARGGNLSATLATENISVTYTGALAKADNYKAGGDFKRWTSTGRIGHTMALDEVGSTAYESRTHTLGFAVRGGNHLVEAKFGYQDVPYQLYPNQRMDMLDNEQKRINLRYLGQYDWGMFEARAYHEQVDHFMDFGADKRFWYGNGAPPTGSGGSNAENGFPCSPVGTSTCAAGMPMYSASKTTGVNLKADVDLGANDLLRVGALYQHYTLHDWWPASGGGMMPGTFENINDGKRDRLGAFAEWERRIGKQWTTLVGARYERVETDAGIVRGYNPSTNGSAPMWNNQQIDAAAYNTRDRNRVDNNIDLTALARYTPNNMTDVEFGLARKVRSPNLYERYTWSTWGMAALMNNFVGDGNGYVGNMDLKPEKAYTASFTFDWHATDRSWELKATPYYTHVDDYIDAVRCNNSTTCASPNATANNRFVTLQYANQSARLYGLDLSGRMPLAKTGLGEFGLRGLMNYTKGENRDTGGNLYNIMPLNGKVALTHQYGSWSNAVELVGVAGKNDTSSVRNEVHTAGYSLTHLRTSYTWKNVRVDFGVENLFDRFYYLPLGGAYTGQGTTMSATGTYSPAYGIAVPGMGRSIYAGVNVKF
ncbi:TonB-dependent receptor plug domain-containing protein [Dechloromonas agitata]|uniref:TonB-dependent receptor plug domain-containing protein n=1 Tax=Dechloromonas agitata TaxID=73030 RepID=UPI000484248F|nr:TonB-dependent receptor [Dechloromonas agitata]